MKSNYFTERDERNIEKTRAIMDELPGFASEFFVGIAARTSPLTRLNYAYDLRIFFDYISKKIFRGRITPQEITLRDLETLQAYDIEMYMEYLTSYTFRDKKFKCGASAKERKICSLRSFFKYYFKKDKLSSNITAKVDLPKVHEKPIIKLEIDEIVKLLDRVESGSMPSKRQNDYLKVTKTRDLALLTLFLGTGIRISECVGLNRADLDFSANAFTVTRKGGDKSILYFSEEVAKALRDYIGWLDLQMAEQTDFGRKIRHSPDAVALFFSLQGNRISVHAVQNLVKKYASLAAPLKKITPHKLRSTYGTALYRETQDIYIVADVLGHKDVNTTKRHYADMSDEIRRAAAKAVKLRENDEH